LKILAGPPLHPGLPGAHFGNHCFNRLLDNARYKRRKRRKGKVRLFHINKEIHRHK
jgi:hypothetical protein